MPRAPASRCDGTVPRSSIRLVGDSRHGEKRPCCTENPSPSASPCRNARRSNPARLNHDRSRSNSRRSPNANWSAWPGSRPARAHRISVSSLGSRVARSTAIWPACASTFGSGQGFAAQGTIHYRECLKSVVLVAARASVSISPVVLQGAKGMINERCEKVSDLCEGEGP